MKVKTSDLIDLPLEYAVAIAEGGTGLWHDTVATWWINIGLEDRALRKSWAQSFTPSTDWSQGGPIIEREGIALDDHVSAASPDERFLVLTWRASIEDRFDRLGPTPLVAAMRCYVASKLGNEIDIPEELLT